MRLIIWDCDSFKESANLLTVEEKGKLFDALLDYASGAAEVRPPANILARGLFASVKRSIDRDQARYLAKQ